MFLKSPFDILGLLLDIISTAYYQYLPFFSILSSGYVNKEKKVQSTEFSSTNETPDYVVWGNPLFSYISLCV